MRLIQGLFLSLFFLTTTISEATDRCLTNKYVFDIGSGGINAVGYIVDTCKDVILKTFPQKYHNLPLQQCISDSPDSQTITEECLTKGRKAITSLKKELAIDCKQQECIAIATAWARNAKNADMLINQFQSEGINVAIISQYDEGQIAFKNFIRSHNIPNDIEKNIIVFDLGGGSFQLSDMDDQGNIQVYHGPYGMFNFKALILSKFASNNNQILPASSLKEIKDFSIQEIWKDLKKNKYINDKLERADLKIFGVGSFFDKGIRTQLSLGKKVSLTDIENAIDKLIGKTSEEIQKIYPFMPKEYASDAQFSLLIIYGLLKEMEVQKLKVARNAQINDYIALNNLP